MAEIEIKLPDLSRVALEPGDVLLVRCPDRIDAQTIHEIRKRLADVFPGHQIAVLPGGMELSVVRPIGEPPERVPEPCLVHGWRTEHGCRLKYPDGGAPGA